MTDSVLFNVVLVSPQIPPNTGNIIRLCANTRCALHLINPLGFDLTDKKLRRAGLDYHEWAQVQVYDSFTDYTRKSDVQRCFLYSKFHSNLYTDVTYQMGDSLVFGSETSGLPDSVRALVTTAQHLTLPMAKGNRSLNLSNSAAIVVYEAWRQIGFANQASI